jgi:hypothetical protein
MKCMYLFISGLYYNPITIVNDDARVVNKLENSVTDAARVVIYEHHMFIIQATGCTATSIVENSAQVLSCQLKFVHE